MHNISGCFVFLFLGGGKREDVKKLAVVSFTKNDR